MKSRASLVESGAPEHGASAQGSHALSREGPAGAWRDAGNTLDFFGTALKTSAGVVSQFEFAAAF